MEPCVSEHFMLFDFRTIDSCKNLHEAKSNQSGLRVEFSSLMSLTSVFNVVGPYINIFIFLCIMRFIMQFAIAKWCILDNKQLLFVVFIHASSQIHLFFKFFTHQKCIPNTETFPKWWTLTLMYFSRSCQNIIFLMRTTCSSK